jgi:predicted AAA+ superfamily ATPase
MTPFQWPEVKTQKAGSLDALWFRGGFPGAFLEESDDVRLDWFDSYTRTFIERDLTALGVEVTGPQMRKLWTMIAHVHGGIWNASQLAASLGVSPHTVNRYVDILEQTFLIRKLQPFFANIGKRLIKSPKIYFRDTGLLHYFLGIHAPDILPTHPARGASWEGLVIDHLIGACRLTVPGSQAFYWRTAAGAEVDLLIQHGDRLTPFEIKLHTAPAAHDVKSLFICMEDLNLPKGYVLSAGRTEYSLGKGVTVLPADRLLSNPEDVARVARSS